MSTPLSEDKGPAIQEKITFTFLLWKKWGAKGQKYGGGKNLSKGGGNS